MCKVRGSRNIHRTTMPSKQQLAKRRKNKKTPVDKRSAGKIYRELPELKPINREYIGHNNAFHNPPDDVERKMKINRDETHR